MNYKEIKQQKKSKSLKLKVIKKLKIKLNLEMQMLGMNAELNDNEKDSKYGELLSQLREAELREIEFRRNKYFSSEYKFIPYQGLNRKQRRQFKNKR